MPLPQHRRTVALVRRSPPLPGVIIVLRLDSEKLERGGLSLGDQIQFAHYFAHVFDNED
jgi:hypothetical protein